MSLGLADRALPSSPAPSEAQPTCAPASRAPRFRCTTFHRRAFVLGFVAGPTLAAGCLDPHPSPDPEAIMQGSPVGVDPALRMQADRSGSGPPLVLVGGGLTGWASWQPHAERLAAKREVVRLQLLSVEYGLDDRPLPAGYSVRTESRALASALDELDRRGPIDLVAWSYGAVVALDFALEHPDRIRTLTLIEPPALWVLPDHGRELPDVQALASLLPEVTGEVGLPTLERFLRIAALVPPGTSPESVPQWESWVQHRRSLRNGRAVFDHSDDPARLPAFRPPVLLVTGRGTSPFLRAIHDSLATALPGVRTLELPGGHAPHLAAMEVFLERVDEFQRSAGAVSETGVGADGPRTVISADGTPIAFWRSGSGPPLLLVHGATADHTTTWRSVLPELARRFTVYAMDRRGRGGSGDGSEYELRREAEDVAAILSTIGEPVSVLGHSYGALVAIEAARLAPELDRLILYEGVPFGPMGYEAGLIERLETLLEQGDLEGMLIALFREVVGASPEDLDLIRSQQDAWAARLRNAPTLPREIRAEDTYVFEPERFRDLAAPTLLLVGGDSPPREHENARGVAGALADGRLVVLPGQQHAAMHSAPDLFVSEVVRFLGAGR